jgi:hypothetical protein
LSFSTEVPATFPAAAVVISGYPFRNRPSKNVDPIFLVIPSEARNLLSLPPVILSAAATKQSEVAAESKDPVPQCSATGPSGNFPFHISMSVDIIYRRTSIY